MWKFLTCKVLAAGALAGIAMISAPQQAHAGCHINLKMANNTLGHTIQLKPDQSKVRTKNGTWRKLTKGGWHPRPNRIKPSKKTTDVYRAAMKCNRKRQFRIAYNCQIGTDSAQARVFYFPSTSSYSHGSDFVIALPC